MPLLSTEIRGHAVKEPDGFEQLANAIIIRATLDYQAILKAKDKKLELDYKQRNLESDLERFFCGKWFTILTDIDGIWLMNALEEQHDNPRKYLRPQTHRNVFD